ncbi:hypothetical protein BGZ94_007795 [Podila epigama]|nr:hypothetical protein BGZ94_007795 [Podila epigama]
MDWDPMRDYDSQTFSEDYNLHGASNRSMDHPSVTRDDFNQADLLDDDDDNSIENADLIADIVDGKTMQDHRTRFTRNGPIRETIHRTDDDSLNSLVRYALYGSQDSEDNLADEHLQNQNQKYIPSQENYHNQDNDNRNEGHFHTPMRQFRNMQSDPRLTKPTPTVQQSQTLAQPGEHSTKLHHSRGVSIDGIPRSGSRLKPPTIRSNPTNVSNDPTSDKPVEQAKPAFRSALKPPNNVKSKPGRHIQLPKEITDDTEDDMDDKLNSATPVSPGMQIGVDARETFNPMADVEQESQTVPHGLPTESDLLPTTPSAVPGPSRFTRITKKTITPAKKNTTTIPAPPIEEVNSMNKDNAKIQKSVKEFRTMLRSLGLLPLSSTLDSALENLTASEVEKGGLVEMMGLLTRLGNMYEKQQEVMHQMTDQIIGGETTRGPSRESEEKLETLVKDLDAANDQITDLKVRNEELVSQVDDLDQQVRTLTHDNQSLQQLQSNQKVTSDDKNAYQATNWDMIEKRLKAKDEVKVKESSTASQSPDTAMTLSGDWKGHIQTIEHELHALKKMLSQHAPIGSNGAALEDLEEQLNDALLENRRLQSKNKTLTKDLLNLQHETSDREELNKTCQKLKALLKDIMSHLGVESHQKILPAFNELQRSMDEMSSMRRFIAKTERIIWESEITAGLVRVHSLGSSASQERRTQEDPPLQLLPGKTCSQSYEATLQRMREWSELLDVLNHVEFEDVDDSSSTATIKPST